MPTQIVEDRTLARIAFDVSGRQASAAAGQERDVALGQAIGLLRVLGIAAGPEIIRTLRADIANIFGDPAEMARARAITSRADRSLSLAASCRSASATAAA